MRHKAIQYIFIVIMLAAITGGYFYFQSDAAQKINASKVNNLTNGLVGYWTFDGADVNTTTAFDKNPTVTKYNGTITGATATAGKVGQAFNFNGSSDSVNVGDIDITDQITVSAWINLKSSTAIYSGIVAKNYPTSWFFGMLGATRDLSIWINDAQRAATSGEPINLNQWQYVSFTYNKDAGGTDEIKIYVNGNQVATGDYSTAIGTDNNDMTIGKNLTQYFDGKIDEVRIYSRALTQSEITELYQQGQTKINASQDGKLNQDLAAHWTFDGNHISGTTISDQAGSNHASLLTATATIGKIGQAMYFSGADGTNNFISIPASSSLDLTGTNFTIVSWIYPETQVDQYPVIYGDGLYGMTLGLQANPATNKLEVWRNDNNGYQSDGAVNLNEWNHVAVAWNGSTYTFYRNGASDGSRAGYAYTFPGVKGIGDVAGGYSATGEFKGKIDEVRIYRKALTQSEITELYQQGQTKINASQVNKLANGLVGYWTLDGQDISGTTVYDRNPTVNKYNGTNVGASSAIGKIGQALAFDSLDYIEIIESGSTNLDYNGSEISLSAWIKLDSGGVPNNSKVIDKSGVFRFWIGGSNCYGENNPPYNFTFGVGIGGHAWGCSNNDLINASEWYHIAGTYSGGVYRTYLNGAADAVISGVSPNVTNNDNKVYIGGDTYGIFPGTIDEVRVYNRALSASEVTELYNMGR